MTSNLGVTLATLALVGIVATLGCERNQEAVATRVVTEWVTDNAEPVADEIAQLLIGEFPDLTRVPEDQDHRQDRRLVHVVLHGPRMRVQCQV